MNQRGSTNNIVIFVTVIALAGLGFFYYRSHTAEVDPLSVSGSADSTGIIGAQLISLIADLDRIKLDKSIFDDKTFQSLTNFSQSIQPQAKGGRNPFSSPYAESATISGSTAGNTTN